MPIITRFFFGVLLFFFAKSAYATHLVGGEITYECVGNNQYEVTLTVYRDCAVGTAPLDFNVIISVYENNLLFSNHTVSRLAFGNVPSQISNQCVTQTPQNVCVEYGIYKVILFLPPSQHGYTITHQRCCRNNTISNIPNPGTWGNTYTVEVPANDTGCNSSPKFKNEPPLILCNGDLLIFDHSATDTDTDSLYYELCTPLHGGGNTSQGNGPTSPVPNPATPPPYTAVPFLAGRSAVNPLPGNPLMSIDPHTGELSIGFNTVGQYVFAVCVTEYRNGVPLSTIRRDYQFNVINCVGFSKANFAPQHLFPQTFCSGTTVNFTSNSINADNHLWIFGDPNNPNDTSTLANPTYTFSDTGTYEITLIINYDDEECADTVVREYTLRHPVNSNFNIMGNRCFETQDMAFFPVAHLSNSNTIEWDFGPNATPRYSSDITPSGIHFGTLGPHNVRLKIKNQECEAQTVETFQLYHKPVADFEVFPTEICKGEDITFVNNTSNDPGYTYLWDFGDGNSSNDYNPNHTYGTPGTFTPTLRVQNTCCCEEPSYHTGPKITVFPTAEVGIAAYPEKTNIFDPTFEIFLTTVFNDSTQNLYWYLGDDTQYQNVDRVSHTYEDTGTFTVWVFIENEFSCWDSATLDLRVDPMEMIYIPTAFSPNNDGTNDHFRAVTMGIKEFYFVVTNRWGNIVFETTDSRETWNGQYLNHGNHMPEGVYTYRLTGTNPDGKGVEKIGTVTLMR